MKKLLICFLLSYAAVYSNNTQDILNQADEFLIKKDFENAFDLYIEAKHSLDIATVPNPYLQYRIKIGKAIAYSLKNEDIKCFEHELFDIWDEIHSPY